ncbi:MAG: oxidase [Rhodothermaceae bacterium]|nr:oxidase [Rhodothermaceae bacterium]
MSDTHLHDDAHGHGGGHHILERDVLLRTFGGLVVLTVLTVGLAFAERADILPLGGLSVPVALAIAGAKATLVAAFFMGLKNDGGTNLLSFVGGVVFLAIFLIFTYLDTGFRDTFDEQSAVPVDILDAEERALLERQEQIAPLQEAQPLIVAPDTLLFPNAPTEPAP